MALYKFGAFLEQTNHAAFDELHEPGAVTPYSGLYRCEGCAVEVVSEHGRRLPPTHASAAVGHPIIWRLVVSHK